MNQRAKLIGLHEITPYLLYKLPLLSRHQIALFEDVLYCHILRQIEIGRYHFEMQLTDCTALFLSFDK
ncbi:Uncharacterised protein [Vibrio cholerae]|nr:Uncharacterised protein [Vibrio cholerae]